MQVYSLDCPLPDTLSVREVSEIFRGEHGFTMAGYDAHHT